MNLITLRCIKEGGKLRVKIISPGYSNTANCRFPKNLRVDGAEYLVPECNISLIDTHGRFFYSIKNSDIKVIYPKINVKDLKIFGEIDEKNPECNICMTEMEELVIFSPCGHYCSCCYCAQKISKCPMCRQPIITVVSKKNLQ